MGFQLVLVWQFSHGMVMGPCGLCREGLLFVWAHVTVKLARISSSVKPAILAMRSWSWAQLYESKEASAPGIARQLAVSLGLVQVRSLVPRRVFHQLWQS